MACHAVVCHNHVITRTHNHIGTTTIVVASTKVVVRIIFHTISVVPIAHRLGVLVGSEVVKDETVGYCRVGTIHIESTTTSAVAMCEVVGDDEVFEFHAMEHAHTCTTVTVCHIINNVAMANGESVPLHIGILFIHAGLVTTDIILPVVAACFVAAVLVALVCTVIAIACHMPGCHTHVGLIQYVVALAEVFVISTSVDQIHGERVGSTIVARYVQFVFRIAINRRLLAYLKYGLIVRLLAVFVSIACRHILRQQRFALLFAWSSVLRESTIHLHAIANYESLVVGVYTCAYPYLLRFKPWIVLMQCVVFGSYLDSQL